MFSFDIAQSILRSMRHFERNDLVNKFIGLSLCPEYQSNHLRILTLIHLSLVHARGHSRPTRSDLVALLNGLRNHESGRNEDPAEDVFVSSVSTSRGQYRIFNGIYPASDFSLQRMLEAVFSQQFPERENLIDQCQALLFLSDLVAERCGLPANTSESSYQWREEWPINLSRLSKLGNSTYFTFDDLEACGIDRATLDAFCLDSVEHLLEVPFGYTALARRPLLKEKGGLRLPIPSLVSPALRLHLAQVIAANIVPEAAIEAFHGALIARWLLLDLPIRKNQLLKPADLSLPEEAVDMPPAYQAVVRFDQDKLAHLIVIPADWSCPPERSIHEIFPTPAGSEQALSEHIRKSQNLLQAGQGTSRGLTLVVYDSPGWNVNYLLPDDLGPSWFCVGLHAHTFAELLNDPQFTLLNLWKMLLEEQDIEAKGIQLRLWPDMLAYWSVWLAFDFTFWPKTLDLRSFGGFAPGTGQIVDVNTRVRRAREAHALPLPTGEWRRVERWVEDGAPEEELLKPIFSEPAAFMAGELRCAIETERGLWWLVVARPPFDEEERRFFYLLWQGTQEWLLRIAKTAGSRLGSQNSLLEIRLLPVPGTMEDAPEDFDFVLADDIPVVTVVLPRHFMTSLATTGNEGEGLLVAALIEGVLRTKRIALDRSEKRAWVASLLADPALKMLHVTMDRDPGLAVDLSVEKASLRFLQYSDLAAAERHMRDKLASDSDSGVTLSTEHVQGKAAVQRALHKVVVIHGTRSQALLNELDRVQAIISTYRLIEAIHRDRVEAERGALARSRFYDDQSGYDLWAKVHMSRRDTAFHVYRVAVEMALCAAPMAGGRNPGISDIDAVAGELQTLIRTGQYSDGVEFGLINEEFHFRPDGALDLRNDGSKTSLLEYTFASFGDVIASDIDAYSELFEPDAPMDVSEFTADASGMFAAFKAEYGLSLIDAVQIVHGLQAVAVDLALDVVALKYSEIKAKFRELEIPIENQLLDLFLGAFGLTTRRRWEKPPIDFSMNDIMPWFFERRLSLMLRPVVVTSNNPDPILIYGVRQVDMGVHYATALLETGIWPREKLRHSTAQNYVEQEIARRGKAFEQEIVQIIQDAGWRVFANIPMPKVGASEDLGELDVLAVSQDSGIWILIECKWFGAARTPREIANWLQDFRGQEGDKLRKHLRRYAWVSEHMDRVATSLGLQRATKILPKIVTTGPVPLAFTANLPAGSDVWTRRELTAALVHLEQF